MPYSESGPDSNFAINSASNFDYSSSKSNSESESDFSSEVMNLDICIFLFYTCIPLNKPVDGFFIYSHNRINSYTSNANIMHIFFWHIITKKTCFYHTIKFSYFSFRK